MTPGWSSGGKRLAGKLHEPFDRADGGRAATPNQLRLYSPRPIGHESDRVKVRQGKLKEMITNRWSWERR
jgi:hypothetical protein